MKLYFINVKQKFQDITQIILFPHNMTALTVRADLFEYSTQYRTYQVFQILCTGKVT